jgi:tetratricopeptide (TPR) repeat protein
MSKDSQIPSVALAMIVKCVPEDLSHLDKCLESVVDHVDAIYVDFNGPELFDKSITYDLVKKFGLKAEYHVWDKNFVKARNDVFKRVPAKFDWILWLDADDTVETPEKIKEVAAIAPKSVQGIHVNYDYTHDAYGNVTCTLMVSRMVRNNKSFSWKSSFDDAGESVHESLVQNYGVNKLGTEDFRVIHHADAERQRDSLYRNIELLEKMHDRLVKKGKPDPRILYYLGVHYYDAGRFGEARQHLVEYLKVSGWPEERSEAWVYVGLIYRMEGERKGQAENCYIQAIKESSANPDAYVELGELCMSEDRTHAAELWYKRAIESPKATTSMILHPQEATFRVFKSLAKLYSHMDGSKLMDARENIMKALKLRPFEPECLELRDLIDELIKIRDQSRAVAAVGRILKQSGDDTKVEEFLNMLPDHLQDNTLVMTMRQDVMKPKKWRKKSMAIYVGESTLGTWGPDNMKTGIGGSEEAVIQLTRQLAYMGWEIVVYATPGQQAGFDTSLDDDSVKVEWKHYWEFNAKDKFDVLISWRNPMFFDYELKARKKYLWIHDIVDKEEFTEYRLGNLNKVMFVSQYHADQYKDVVPADKIFVTGNGIDPEAFEGVDGKFTRTAHRMIYMSAHERGLEVLYDIWPDVKKAIPDAILDVYYGWLSYDAITKDNPPLQQWKNDMVAKERKLVGVANNGRIGHEQIIEEINKSDIFAYPCIFPEVYCISLIKAMAGGAMPVTSDFAVVGDYNTWGPKVHLGGTKQYEDFKKAYTKQLIKSLKNSMSEDERMKMAKATRIKFSWEKTAEGWQKEMS